MGLTLEICVEDAVGALAAGMGGADRVEQCAHLAVGGITPSAGAVALAVGRLLDIPVRVPVHVLIRPRGDASFVATSYDRVQMLHDVETCARLGTAGVVVGALDHRGDVDVPLVRELVAATRPMSVTFHRAFDIVRDPFAALDALIELGVDRVLTSAGPGPARDHLDRLAALVDHARERIVILAGGGVTADDFPLLAAAGVREVHVGSAAMRGGSTSRVAVHDLAERARATALP